MLLSLSTGAQAAPRNKIVDYALTTDIVATVNGHPMPSYNVGGATAVVVEDLRGYGFNVRWDPLSYSLFVTRTTRYGRISLPAVWPHYTPKAPDAPVGSKAQPVYESSIKTYLDGKTVDSFNIGGRTLVRVKDLGVYGKVSWSETARVSELTLEEQPLEKPLEILMYHDIVPCESAELGDWTTTEARFRADLEWLRDNGYTTYLPSELAAGAPVSDRAVMITFDDGYESNYTVALPLLREYGMKAAVCVICERIDNRVDGFLSWAECREMAASGLIEFGSHTYDLHGGIQRRPGEGRDAYNARLAADIGRSIDDMRVQLGQEPLLFAYPHGTVELWADDYLEKTFAITVSTEIGTADLACGTLALPRYNINAVQPVSMFLEPLPVSSVN